VTPQRRVATVVEVISRLVPRHQVLYLAERLASRYLEPRLLVTVRGHSRAAASVVETRVPLATLSGYVPALRGMTHGRGTAIMNPAGHEIVPD
jgi:translation elongation factor EF-G